MKTINNKDIVETLRLTIERRHALKARFKEKVYIRQMRGDKVAWEGDVYVFGLAYDSKASGASKEQIASWKLPGPTAKALEAAEKRGRRLRKQLETGEDRRPAIKRLPKLAYAWSSPVKGSAKRRVHVVLHEGAVKSPADAVRLGMGRG